MSDRAAAGRRGAGRAREQAGPLGLADTSRREWDIVMSRGEQSLRVRAGITDPEQVHRDLEWYRLGNRSVTFHVVERITTLHEELVDELTLPRP